MMGALAPSEAKVQPTNPASQITPAEGHIRKMAQEHALLTVLVLCLSMQNTGLSQRGVLPLQLWAVLASPDPVGLQNTVAVSYQKLWVVAPN